MLPSVLEQVRDLVSDRRVTVVFDRGGWSPKLFAKLLDDGFDILTYPGYFSSRRFSSSHNAPSPKQRDYEPHLEDGYLLPQGGGSERVLDNSQSPSAKLTDALDLFGGYARGSRRALDRVANFWGEDKPTDYPRGIDVPGPGLVGSGIVCVSKMPSF